MVFKDRAGKGKDTWVVIYRNGPTEDLHPFCSLNSRREQQKS